MRRIVDECIAIRAELVVLNRHLLGDVTVFAQTINHAG